MKPVSTYIALSALFLCTTVLPVHCFSNGVTLTSDLNPLLASPQQIVNFHCITTDSNILEWHSPEYIGANELQILSHSEAQTSVMSTNPSTIATKLSASGSSMIVSELQITASTQYPLSSVTCLNGALRSNLTIRFHTFETYVHLTSETVIARPEQLIVFTCTTRGSIILEWESEEYIGAENLQIFSLNSTSTVTVSVSNPSTSATRVSSTIESGLSVIVSQLRIVVSQRYPTVSVTCHNVATGANRTIGIQVYEQTTGPTAAVPNTQSMNGTSSSDRNSTTAAVSSVHTSTYIAVSVSAVFAVLLVIVMIITATFVYVYFKLKLNTLSDVKIHVECGTDDLHVEYPKSSQTDSSVNELPRESLDSENMPLDEPKVQQPKSSQTDSSVNESPRESLDSESMLLDEPKVQQD